MRRHLLVVVSMLASVSTASAAGLQVVDKTILAMPGQEALIVATGAGMIGGADLWIQVGDGGDLGGGDDVPGVDAARITAVEFWGSGWVSPDPPTPDLYNGLLAHASAVLQTPRPVPELIALLILDGTGLVPGQQFTVALGIPAFGETSDFAGDPAEPLVSGVITVIPEPAAALLLMLGSALVGRRRRH